MLDRTIAPPFSLPSTFIVAPPESFKGKNGISVHSINSGAQSILRLELIAHTGFFREHTALSSSVETTGTSFFAAKMLSEGTKNFTSKQLQDYLAQYGAFYEVDHTPYYTYFTFYVLKKYLPFILTLSDELLDSPLFPEHEWEGIKNRILQKLRVDLEKNDFVANRSFYELLFGENHPAGKHLTEESIRQVSLSESKNFYHRELENSLFDVVLAGKLDEDTQQTVHNHFEKRTVKVHLEEIQLPSIPKTYSSKLKLIERQGSLQSSIRMGRPTFPKKHSDYIDLSILNEVLGGYFGSRLMKNIREEKGFTYGIASRLRSFQQEGCLVIGTDVKREFTKQTIDEIVHELKQLRTELISEDELMAVKNYMKGELLGSVGTSFERADKFKHVYLHGLDCHFYQKLYSAIDAITPARLLELANQYLREEDMLTVVVGGY